MSSHYVLSFYVFLETIYQYFVQNFYTLTHDIKWFLIILPCKLLCIFDIAILLTCRMNWEIFLHLLFNLVKSSFRIWLHFLFKEISLERLLYFLFLFIFFSSSFFMSPKVLLFIWSLTSHSWSFCLNPLKAGIAGMSHHVCLTKMFNSYVNYFPGMSLGNLYLFKYIDINFMSLTLRFNLISSIFFWIYKIFNYCAHSFLPFPPLLLRTQVRHFGILQNSSLWFCV